MCRLKQKIKLCSLIFNITVYTCVITRKLALGSWSQGSQSQYGVLFFFHYHITNISGVKSLIGHQNDCAFSTLKHDCAQNILGQFIYPFRRKCVKQLNRDKQKRKHYVLCRQQKREKKQATGGQGYLTNHKDNWESTHVNITCSM